MMDISRFNGKDLLNKFEMALVMTEHLREDVGGEDKFTSWFVSLHELRQELQNRLNMVEPDLSLSECPL